MATSNPLLRLLIDRDKRLQDKRPKTNALSRQVENDNAPAGSVGAPSGVAPVPSQGQDRDPAGALLNAAAMLPGAGDVIGPMADIRNFVVNPKSRTAGNAALFALGVLPAIPSLAFLMSRGGGSTNPLARIAKGQSGAIGYHGSPHRFDAFDMSKIGTGEGAQAYGHGMYFAESERVAKEYQRATSKDRFLTPSGLFDPSELEHLNVRVKARSGDIDQAIAEAKKYAVPDHDYPETAAKAARDLAKLEQIKAAGGYAPNQGNLYTVDIPDEAIDKMLDWDRPLSEQPEIIATLKHSKSKTIREIVAKLEESGFRASSYGEDLGPHTGESLHRALALNFSGRSSSSKEASDALRKAGIPGIKYLDAGSRGAGQGTRNFVVFDDQLPKILKRE